MRIHTNLDAGDLREALHRAGAPIYFERSEEFGSATHPRAFEVRLGGSGGRNNTGIYGAGDYEGATWDEWGAFFGSLFALDPAARCGGTARRPVYADAEDYHFQTGDRFRGRPTENGVTYGWLARVAWTYLPADTHPRHRWVFDSPRAEDTVYHCAKAGCSATRPSHNAIQSRRAAA